MTQVYTIEADTLVIDYTGDGSRTATIHRNGRLIIAGYGAGVLDRVMVDATYPEINDAVNRTLRDMRGLGLYLDAAQTEIVFGF